MDLSFDDLLLSYLKTIAFTIKKGYRTKRVDENRSTAR